MENGPILKSYKTNMCENNDFFKLNFFRDLGSARASDSDSWPQLLTTENAGGFGGHLWDNREFWRQRLW